MWGKHSLHLHNLSGSHSHAFSALCRQGADPDWLILLSQIWLFLQTREFVGWTELLWAVSGTAVVEGVVWAGEVIGRLWVVFNGQLQGFGCVLDHTVDLEERSWRYISPSTCCTILSYESYLLSCNVPDRNTINFQYPVPNVHRKRVTTEDSRVQPVRQFSV